MVKLTLIMIEQNFTEYFNPFIRLGNTEKIVSWKSKDLLIDKLTTSTTTDNSLSPSIIWYRNSILFNQESAIYTPLSRIYFFIIYELNSWPWDLDSDFTLGNCLFRGVKLAKNADPDQYGYSVYNIRFDKHIEYSLPDGSVSKNVIFGVFMSSSVYIDSKEESILILGKGVTQKLNYTLAAEIQYSINFKRSYIRFCLSLHHNGCNNF